MQCLARKLCLTVFGVFFSLFVVQLLRDAVVPSFFPQQSLTSSYLERQWRRSGRAISLSMLVPRWLQSLLPGPRHQDLASIRRRYRDRALLLQPRLQRYVRRFDGITVTNINGVNVNNTNSARCRLVELPRELLSTMILRGLRCSDVAHLGQCCRGLHRWLFHTSNDNSIDWLWWHVFHDVMRWNTRYERYQALNVDEALVAKIVPVCCCWVTFRHYFAILFCFSFCFNSFFVRYFRLSFVI